MKLKPVYRLYLSLVLVMSLLACVLMPVTAAFADVATIHEHGSSEHGASTHALGSMVVSGVASDHPMPASAHHDNGCDEIPVSLQLQSSLILVDFLLSGLSVADPPYLLDIPYRRYSTVPPYPPGLRSHLALSRIHV